MARVSTPRRRAATDAHLDRLVEAFLNPEGVGRRQLAFTVVYLMSWVLVALPPVRPAGGTPAWSLMWLGSVMVVGVQVAGVLVPWARLAAGWQSVLPLVQMGALVALHHGSGAGTAVVDVLLLLPVVSLGLQATWTGVVLAAVGTVGVQVGLAFGGPDAVAALLVPETAVVSAVALLIAVGTAGAARRLRALAPEVVEQRQDEVIGIVGHELRSPLTSVLGYAQLLGVERLTEEQHRYVDVIDRNGRRLLRSINELLVSARLAGREIIIDRRDVDLVQVSRESADELGPTARAAGLSLTVVPLGPVWVSGDPELLAQVITSMLGSAIKLTPRGGAVTMRLGLRGVRTPEAVIEVVDTGAGLGPEALSRLSAPAYRAHGAEGHNILGIGFGLPLVRAIVDVHGGTMDVDSVPGEGTRVTVTLPVRPLTGSSAEAGSTPG